MRPSHRSAEPEPSRTAAAEEELREFSYIVSHDLAASFRHLAGFSRLLLGELGDELTGRQREHADQIRAASDKCLLMMEQLLVFSRVQQKPFEPARQDATPTMQLVMLQLAMEVRAADARRSLSNRWARSMPTPACWPSPFATRWTTPSSSPGRAFGRASPSRTPATRPSGGCASPTTDRA
jgi:signal transduction histidine kinase